MNTFYTRSQLETKKLVELKEIASKLGVAPETDSRKKESWITVILKHQPSEVTVTEWGAKGETSVTYPINPTERTWLDEKMVFQTPSYGWKYRVGYDFSEERFRKLPDVLAAYAEHLNERDLLREQHSLECAVVDVWGGWYTVVDEHGEDYMVNLELNKPEDRCSCKDAKYRGVKCEHQMAVVRHVTGDGIRGKIVKQLVQDFSWCRTESDLREYLSYIFDSVDGAILSGAARDFLKQTESKMAKSL